MIWRCVLGNRHIAFTRLRKHDTVGGRKEDSNMIIEPWWVSGVPSYPLGWSILNLLLVSRQVYGSLAILS